MSALTRFHLASIAPSLLLALLTACSGGNKDNTSAATGPAATGKDAPASAAAAATKIALGAYTTPREAYGTAVLPAFRAQWKTKTGGELTVQESYLGSGAQARAIVGGFEADVAALSLEPDIEKIRKAGLITHDWKAGEHGGMVTR
ncbi:MAG TPA: hypothetical protein VK509_11020, partial [Polyangiales bacterium]|nr:hypothetical protein [Polyangiales bacterium]